LALWQFCEVQGPVEDDVPSWAFCTEGSTNMTLNTGDSTAFSRLQGLAAGAIHTTKVCDKGPARQQPGTAAEDRFAPTVIQQSTNPGGSSNEAIGTLPLSLLLWI